MKTGIDWCELDVTDGLVGLAAEARARESRVRGLVEGGGEEHAAAVPAHHEVARLACRAQSP